MSEHHGPHGCRDKHGKQGRGPSSAWLHDPKTVLGLIPIKPGDVFVDLGCGVGDYSLEASRLVHAAGKVYAIDKWPYLIDALLNSISSLEHDNIVPLVADITATLPLNDDCADVVFMATVLHIYNLKEFGPPIFKEVARILAPDGCLAVVECKKEEQKFGPPKHMRQSPEEIEAAAAPYGFEKIRYDDLGYNYLIQFHRRR